MSDQLNLFDTRAQVAAQDASADAALERSVRRLKIKGETVEHIASRHSIKPSEVRHILGKDPVLLSIEDRWTEFAARNPHVLAGALQIARAWLERGDRYISAKAIMENLRVSKRIISGDGGYKLNNDFTAPLGRWLVQHEPKLEGVIRFRERKAR